MDCLTFNASINIPDPPVVVGEVATPYVVKYMVNENAVLFTPQVLTDAQKQQARTNIDSAKKYLILGAIPALTKDSTPAEIYAVLGDPLVLLDAYNNNVLVMSNIYGSNYVTAIQALKQGEGVYMFAFMTLYSTPFGLYIGTYVFTYENSQYYVDTIEVSTGLTEESIVDNLTTNDPTKVLSAAQGYALNNKIGDIATAEQARQSAETNRQSAEAARVNAEGVRAIAEQQRSEAESSRANAETNRINSESARVTAESNRTNAETARVTSEQARQSAETKRQTDTTTAITNATNATQAANTAAAQIVDPLDLLAHEACTVDERLKRLEKLLVDVLSGRTIVPLLQARTVNVWDGTNIMLTGAGAPTLPADKVGQLYFDTTNKVVYVATAAESVSNWKLV